MNRRPLFLMLAAVFVGIPTARGADEVNEYLGVIAEDVASFLRSKHQSAVVVRFTGPTTLASAAAGGDALTQMLADKLKTQGITVGPRAEFGVNGRFLINPSDQPLQAKLITQIVDANDAPVYEVKLIDGFITKPRKINELFGLTNEFKYPPNHGKDAFNMPPGNQEEQLRNSLKKPNVTIQNVSLVKPSPASVYSMELVLGDKPLSISNKQGEAYAGVNLGDEYFIRVTNKSPYESAIAVTVDGLNVFQFSQLKATSGERRGMSKYQYYIVPPGQSHMIRGWHMNEVNGQAHFKGFRVAPLEESLAFKLGRPAKIGMITATFHHCWSDGQQAPNDEPEVFPQLPAKWKIEQVRERGPDGVERMVTKRIPIPQFANMGTTFGSDSIASMTGVKRTIGIERASITVRYDRPDKQ